MDIGKSFTFVFEDKDWITKILIAAAILLLGIIFSWMLLIPLILAYALLSGYGVEILRQVVRGDLDKLPEWDDWGALLIEGVKVIVIGLVYALPLIIVALCLGVPIGAL
jgi:Sec-independent protein secretion pathway component TatC